MFIKGSCRQCLNAGVYKLLCPYLKIMSFLDTLNALQGSLKSSVPSHSKLSLRRSCRQRLNAHNDRRRKRVGGEGVSGGDGRSVYRGRGRPRRGGGRRGRGRRPRGESSEVCRRTRKGWHL